MDMGSEELEGIDSASKIWGNLLNQEQLRQLGLDQPEPKKGDKKRQKTQPERTDRDSRSTSSTAVPNEVLKQLIRLTLRHEDHLNCLMQESQFLIHMNPGKGSIVLTLLQASQQWHAAKEKDMSLRHHLACTMIQTLEFRLQRLTSATPTEELFVPRLCEVSSHMSGPRQDNAVPTLVPSETEPSTNFGSGIADQRSPAQPGQHTEDNGRPTSDTALSRAHQAEGGTRVSSGDPVALDSLASSVAGVVARAESTVLPQYLAAHPDPATSPAPGQATFGQAVAEGVVRLIPVFLNQTGTICFANAAVLCLAWMTLLVDGFHPQMWTTGFELLRNVYQAAHRPMDLLNHNPFLWLLMGSWTVDRLHHQQDVCEFLIYLLSMMRPKFLHCEWVTKVALTATPTDNLLEWEKGQQFTPILLPYINHHDATCQLQDLVHQWHEPQGFCRAASEVGQTLILMIDRFNPETQLKCHQIIRFGDQIAFPCFLDDQGTVSLQPFDICGVIFHL